MHYFSIVLEDGSDVFFEDDHGRYFLLLEDQLKELAARRGVRCPKDFDGFIEAERLVDARAGSLSDREWLTAYSEEREKTQPLWFQPADAMTDIEILRTEVEGTLVGLDEDDLEFLLEALDVLLEALEAAKTRGSRFMLATM